MLLLFITIAHLLFNTKGLLTLTIAAHNSKLHCIAFSSWYCAYAAHTPKLNTSLIKLIDTK